MNLQLYYCNTLLTEKDHVVSKLIFEEEDATAPMEIEITKIQETTESTMEIVVRFHDYFTVVIINILLILD